MPPPPADTDDDEEFRKMTLAEGVSITGSTGLLRTAYAGSSAPGIFRVSFLADWWTGGFLCGPDSPCSPGNFSEDDASHVGAFFGLNVTPLSFLEAYAQIRTYANSNNQSSPQLLQVLGDTTLGVKAFTPMRIADLFTFGGDLRLHLLNGAGSVGVSGGGTSAEILALASTDLREIKGEGVGVPLRFHFNTGYRVDNSGALVDDVETLRAQRDPDNANDAGRIPISRIERFGLGINRVDFWEIRLGADVPYRWVQPYLEYSVDIPINRQGYECHVNDPLSPSPGDACLALSDIDNVNSGGIGYSAIPSRLSLGARTNPFDGTFRGLSAHLAFDIGLSGTSTFVEEVAPTAPWTLYIGLQYAFDTKEPEPETAPPPPPPPPMQLPPPPQYFVRGTVVETGTQNPVPDAIISVQGSTEPPVASGADGKFLSREVQPGAVNLAITAPGYKEGTCTAQVQPAATPPGPMGQPGMPPGMGGQPGMPPGMGGQPGMPPGQPPGMGGPGQPPMGQPPQQPTGPQFTDVQCELESLPKDGGVKGTVSASEGGTLTGVTVELTDARGQAHTATTGPDGSFVFPKLPLGEATVTAQSNDHLIQTQTTTVRPREQVNVTFSLNERPKRANVRLIGRQIQVLKKIHFELNSAKIKGDSFSLLEEIADFMIRNPNIKKVEIQGHTDNSGTREINQRLSQDRADAVRGWLVDHSVESSRLTAKGYGASRPLAPNVTPANRARNRRVQFVVLEKE
jgi:outer membrane protein OmpA-like peptidoglycan-associated protein